ncbi:MAG: NAD(P)/FAD-dependent oxidoreductase [Actinobacteria bacterium]|nr:NAD(P)/FAD-dependent oxidoreductase [Actinomycetota bacterium]
MMRKNKNSIPKVVIIGAGFGGLWAARSLASTQVEILLLDRNNYHTFAALLYQVAAAELGPEDIVHPVRNIFRKLPNVHVEMADVETIDMTNHQIRAADRLITYDYLIIATGSETSFFGIPGAAEYAFPLKTLEDSIRLRNNILYCFEKAILEENPEYRRRLLTFTIVGGGPTGIEIAGALIELVRGPVKKDFTDLDPNEVRIILIEATDNLLPGFPECCRDYSNSRLRQMGVEIYVGSPVTRITKDSIRLKSGQVILTQTIIWVAGVGGNSLAKKAGLELVQNGRVKVQQTLQLRDYPEIYVIGDLVYFEKNGKSLQMIAPVAIQQATVAANNIKRQINGKKPEPFNYRDPGFMVIIGRNTAIARIKNRSFTGFPAWVLWLMIHILKLIGFRNRLLVLISWALDYFFYERGVRIILPMRQSKDN